MTKEVITNADLLEHIIGIKENVSGINQHLKDMNGSLLTHAKEINKNDCDIVKLKTQIAYWGGAVAVIATVINLAITKFL